MHVWAKFCVFFIGNEAKINWDELIKEFYVRGVSMGIMRNLLTVLEHKGHTCLNRCFFDDFGLVFEEISIFSKLKHNSYFEVILYNLFGFVPEGTIAVVELDRFPLY